MLGGLYQVPLDSFIQVASPNKKRGQIVATANFMSFMGVLAASAYIYIVSGIFGVAPNKSFSILGVISLVVSAVFVSKFFDYTTRFIGMALSFLHFRTSLKGADNLPKGPAVYVCKHTAWNDTLLLLGAQRKRMRFFIEKEQAHSKWMKKLYQLLRVFLIPEIEEIKSDEKTLKAIKKTLRKDISVCIFVENEDVYSEIEKLKESKCFEEAYEGASYPIVPVFIEKGDKEKQAKYFNKLLAKFRIPASIKFNHAI